MENIIRFNTVKDYNVFADHETLHPLVSVLHMEKASPRPGASSSYGFYAVFLKEDVCGDLRYGHTKYDYDQGTLVFIGPGQVIKVDNNGEMYYPKGYGLIFHPDLLHGTPLGRRIQEFSFFNYQSNEGLHISERERKLIIDSLMKIEYELERDIDKHSKKLITANIELFLDYCSRFFDRQFITREPVHKGVLENFENVLKDYYKSDKPKTVGLPSVSYCAGELNLSANYFGDVIKKETGLSAKEYIQDKMITIAKEKIFDFDKSINQIADELGFKYPQHFIRLFKQKTGQTPNQYRSQN